MRHYLKSFIITLVTLYFVYSLISTIKVGADIKNILLIIGGFWILFQIISPIFSIVLLPINILTFSLVSFALNIALVYALLTFLPGFKISPYTFPGINLQGVILPSFSFNLVETIILTAILITITQKVLHLIFE